jgi:biopolymer transport protein ExbB/TolQ
MGNLNAFIEENVYTIIALLTTIMTVSIIWSIITSYQLAALNRRYKKFMKGTSGKNIEGMILEELDNLKANDEKFNAIENKFVLMQEQMDKCIQKHSIVRYNAFNDTGSDLSYSIALMDNFENGITITGIYGRNEFIGYAKPIENGASSYPLSVEEQMAITRCSKKRGNNKSKE